MSEIYQVSLGTRMLRKAMKPIAKTIFRCISKLEVYGLENIPREGAYVGVFNHVSIFDPVVLLAIWPTEPEIVGATDVWKRRGHDVLAQLWKAIPINRGEVDREAMQKILAVLRSNKPLLLAPEGTRSHVPGMNIAKPGVVYIIEATKSKVIPIGVEGTTSDLFKQVGRGIRPRIVVRIGSPFDMSEIPTQGLPPKEGRQIKVDQIMRRIADLLPEAYKGAYSENAKKPETGGNNPVDVGQNPLP